jgi:Peptidase family M49
MKYFVSAFFLIAFILQGCEQKKEEVNKNETEGIEMVKKEIANFSPTELKYDDSILDDRQKIVVEKLYRASKLIDSLFLNQVYSKNEEIKADLMSQNGEVAKLKLELFNIMFGPFDRLEHDKPFIGTAEKPAGANFYPEDMTKEEFEGWIKNHPGDQKSFTSEFTMIRRAGDSLVAIPYSEYFKDKLTEISNLLKDAAGYADHPSLKKYLLTRAVAFLSNDYYESDMAWMDVKDNDIEVVIGPYEVYEDNLYNYKASFESFLTIKDPAESKKLDVFKKYLKDMELHLPIPKEYKNLERGSESPIAVVNEVFVAGDSKAAVQTLAFNLPNDERVRKAKGSKKVMLKNVSEAKYEKQLIPIAKIVLDQEQLQYVTFNSFFTHALMHEMSHGIGPGFIKVNGRNTEVRIELKETYATLEECKADILGMYNNVFMIEKGIFPKSFEKETYVSFLAGIFRTVRFGINEAHGGGNAIIYNYLLENGGYEYDEATQKVKVNFDKAGKALKDLANMILMIQAKGDYNAAKELIKKDAVISPSMQTLINKLSDIPVDIKPVFQIEEMLK